MADIIRLESIVFEQNE